MAAPPAEGGGDGSSEGEDTKMGDDDQSGKKTASPPAGTGLEGTTEGAFMVVGTVERTRRLLEKLKMPEAELMTPGPWVQRTWFAVMGASRPPPGGVECRLGSSIIKTASPQKNMVRRSSRN